MIVGAMSWDQLQKFARCLIDNGNGTFSLRTTAGSASGTSCRAAKRSDIMKAFDKAISTNAVRVV